MKKNRSCSSLMNKSVSYDFLYNAKTGNLTSEDCRNYLKYNRQRSITSRANFASVEHVNSVLKSCPYEKTTKLILCRNAAKCPVAKKSKSKFYVPIDLPKLEECPCTEPYFEERNSDSFRFLRYRNQSKSVESNTSSCSDDAYGRKKSICSISDYEEDGSSRSHKTNQSHLDRKRIISDKMTGMLNKNSSRSSSSSSLFSKLSRSKSNLPNIEENRPLRRRPIGCSSSFDYGETRNYYRRKYGIGSEQQRGYPYRHTSMVSLNDNESIIVATSPTHRPNRYSTDLSSECIDEDACYYPLNYKNSKSQNDLKIRRKFSFGGRSTSSESSSIRRKFSFGGRSTSSESSSIRRKFSFGARSTSSESSSVRSSLRKHFYENKKLQLKDWSWRSISCLSTDSDDTTYVDYYRPSSMYENDRKSESACDINFSSKMRYKVDNEFASSLYNKRTNRPKSSYGSNHFSSSDQLSDEPRLSSQHKGNITKSRSICALSSNNPLYDPDPLYDPARFIDRSFDPLCNYTRFSDPSVFPTLKKLQDKQVHFDESSICSSDIDNQRSSYSCRSKYKRNSKSLVRSTSSIDRFTHFISRRKYNDDYNDSSEDYCINENDNQRPTTATLTRKRASSINVGERKDSDIQQLVPQMRGSVSLQVINVLYGEYNLFYLYLLFFITF